MTNDNLSNGTWEINSQDNQGLTAIVLERVKLADCPPNDILFATITDEEARKFYSMKDVLPRQSIPIVIPQLGELFITGGRAKRIHPISLNVDLKIWFPELTQPKYDEQYTIEKGQLIYRMNQHQIVIDPVSGKINCIDYGFIGVTLPDHSIAYINRHPCWPNLNKEGKVGRAKAINVVASLAQRVKQ